MNMIPQPRFAVGDRVWTAEAFDEPVFVECPDCKGAKTWTATSPAGEEFQFPCPRCQTHDVWKLRHQKAVYQLRQLTIGSVRIDTESHHDKISYMCNETGVGSGTIWSESRLASDEVGAEILGKFAVADREAWRATELERRERNRGGPKLHGLLEARTRYHSFVTAEITAARSAQYSAEIQLDSFYNAVAELDEYGGIQGLDSPTLDRICAHLADQFPKLTDARDSVLQDRRKAG